MRRRIEIRRPLDGDRFQDRFDALAASGQDVHGEARFVMRFAPESVLDAGCGTGRVALELARRGVFVIGADRDPSMLAVARDRARQLLQGMPFAAVRFLECDLVDLDLGGTVDLVLMAGNVPLFADPGTERRIVERTAAHVRPGGLLVSGFQLDGSYSLEAYDLHCAAAGLRLVERFASWSSEPFVEGGDYAVSVHLRS